VLLRGLAPERRETRGTLPAGRGTVQLLSPDSDRGELYCVSMEDVQYHHPAFEQGV